MEYQDTRDIKLFDGVVMIDGVSTVSPQYVAYMAAKRMLLECSEFFGCSEEDITTPLVLDHFITAAMKAQHG